MRHAFLTMLLAALVLPCMLGPAFAQKTGPGDPFAGFDKEKPLAGESAPRLHAKDTQDVEMDLGEYLGQWVVIEFGSYT